MSKRYSLCLLGACVLTVAATAAGRNAKNVILFLGDAGGLSTLHAASVHGYDKPNALFIQRMPHIGLMDTSAVDSWVTDSANGMTAIVTGEKTKNGVISQSGDAVRGQSDGKPLKTILEHAEERGLSTGVISNMSMADATPAACYAHSNDRGTAGEIFAQVLTPRFGDGVDLVIGGGRKAIYAATEKMGLKLDAALQEKGYAVLDSVTAIPAGARRVVALVDGADFELGPVVERAIGILSRNPKGFFLMVEWDMHTSSLRRGLDRVLVMDRVIEEAARGARADTLIVFSADHSFDIRLRAGKKGVPILPAEETEMADPSKANIRVDNGHTGEQVVVAAQGPGAERVRGFFSNTDLFHVMMAAYGWERLPAGR